MEDGNPDNVVHGGVTMINYYKRELVYNTLREIRMYQQSAYKYGVLLPAFLLLFPPSLPPSFLPSLSVRVSLTPSFSFPVVEPIHTFLTALPFSEEKDLYELSLQREPRQH